ncbi:MAG TPA: ABC transporter substrate-binding protein [Polyangiaceae bacterium]|nr:ABC transporter substrate-binding protein [Polyangiaceae bacterium]
MNTRRLLLFLPLAIVAFLLSSALWVPTSSSQAKGDAKRLTTYIEAKLGDPKNLNPGLYAESTASEIVERRVFEGLVDADEHLNLRPKLAERWDVKEEAYLAAVPERELPGGKRATAAALLARLQEALAAGELPWLTPILEGMELVPEVSRPFSESVLHTGKDGKPEPYAITGTVAVPERVKLRLSRVRPDLFTRLRSTFGAAYFDGYPFESRFRLDKPADMPELRPKLADSLAVGEHNPVITFYLRKGVRWHDGHPFTSADAKFTFEAISDPKNASPRSSMFELVRDFTVLDEYTARVAYRRLYSSAIIDWAQTQILPEHLLNKAAMAREMERKRLSPEARKTFSMRNTDFNRAPVGTGPFRLVKWRPDEYIRLERFADYWGQKPEYETIYTRSIPDYLAQELELRVGAIDEYIPLPHQAARYRKDENYQVVSQTEGYYNYIAYNARRPLFQDARVRRALGMAIDVDAIIKSVLSGEGSRATGPFYSYTEYYDQEVKPLPYDPAGAEKLLNEVGWHKNRDGVLSKDGKPFEFTLITNAENPQRKAIISVAQEAWRKLGIVCHTQVFEWTVFIGEFTEKDNFDALVLGWVGGDINPDIYQIWHSSQSDPYELNYAGFKNDEADRLMDQIREEYDHAEQVKLTRRLHRVIAEQQPYTFLYSPTRPHVLDKRIMLVNRDANGRETYEKITPTPSGEINYYFERWRKLSALPVHAEQ